MRNRLIEILKMTTKRTTPSGKPRSSSSTKKAPAVAASSSATTRVPTEQKKHAKPPPSAKKVVVVKPSNKNDQAEPSISSSLPEPTAPKVRIVKKKPGRKESMNESIEESPMESSIHPLTTGPSRKRHIIQEEDLVAPAAEESSSTGSKKKTTGESSKPSPRKKTAKGGSKETAGENLNEFLTVPLKALGDKEDSAGNHYKARAYWQAVAILKKHPERITSGKEAQKLPKIGKSIGAKIDELIETGHLTKLEEMSADPQSDVLELFQQIAGVGPKTAIEWYDQGARTMQDIAERPDLTHHQRLGIKYFDDFKQRIPRNEADIWNSLLTKEILNAATSNPDFGGSDVHVMMAGSYRRGMETCGDVDILISCPEEETKDHHRLSHLLHFIVNDLIEKGIIVDTLSLGEKKFMGVARLPASEAVEKRARRIDITIMPQESYWTGILHHTGSNEFNRHMRQLAIAQGMQLSEYGLVNEQTGEKLLVNSEQDIFRILGEPWKEPHERSW